jgi:hypothetical protein
MVSNANAGKNTASSAEAGHSKVDRNPTIKPLSIGSTVGLVRAIALSQRDNVVEQQSLICPTPLHPSRPLRRGDSPTCGW